MGGLSEYEWLTWLGIVFCLSQSAMFSGLNLALLGISRLRLEIEGAADSNAAKRILATVAALPNAAFEQDAVLLRLDQVAGARHLLCRAMKCD